MPPWNRTLSWIGHSGSFNFKGILVATFSTLFLKIESLSYISGVDSMGLPHSNFCRGLRNTHLLCNRVRIGRSRSSKVDDLGSNQKRICDFLLVIQSNPIFCTVSEIRRLISWKLRIFLTPLSFGAPAPYMDPLEVRGEFYHEETIELSSSEDRMIIAWVFLTQYERVTDRRRNLVQSVQRSA